MSTAAQRALTSQRFTGDRLLHAEHHCRFIASRIRLPEVCSLATLSATPSASNAPDRFRQRPAIMTASMSQEAVFAIFGLICLLGVLFICTRVPETRGHTLEEIEKFEKGTKRLG